MHRNCRSIRIFILLLMILSFCLGSFANAQTEKTFTPAELSHYNGHNGVPAYVAVNGVVYDLTNVPEWAGGRHFCAQAAAGKDISFLWNLVPRSHRNPDFLKRFPVVGKMAAAVKAKDQSLSSHSQQGKGPIFTLRELSKYNGQNGVPAYVAVNGVVYDLTKVPEWAGGRHFCAQAAAGKDITWLWNLTPRSHRNPDFLKRFPVIGRLAANNSGPSEPSQESSPDSSSLIVNLLIGLGLALILTFGWLIFSLSKKKLH